MPIQCSVTQPNGATATYHVVMNATTNYTSPPNGTCDINSYFDAAHAADPNGVPLGSFKVDISPLVGAPLVAAPSIKYATEIYLLSLPVFAGGTQVS